MTETRNIGEPQTLPITDLNLHHKNARIGDVDTIKGSMVANGVYKPIVVNKGTYTGRPNEVLAGNHSLKAMRQLAEENPTDPRWQNIAVWLVDVDEERATRILLADNATADKGTYDQAGLLELLEAVDHDLDGTGYDYADLDELQELLNDENSGGVDDLTEGSSLTLAERFGVPPLTVLDARRGAWQERKKAWIASGIASHEGRDSELIYADRTTLYANWYEVKNEAVAKNPDITADEIEQRYAHKLRAYGDGVGTSVFDPVLCELLYAWFSKRGDVTVDPWAGGSVRGIIAAATGRAYRGHELSPKQCTANREQWETYTPRSVDKGDMPAPVWIEGDSRETLRETTGVTADFIIGCPPYYDLENYSENPNDLSNLSTGEFDAAMRDTLHAADKLLANNRFAAFVVGAVRDKRGVLRDMKKCMIDAAPDTWTLANDAVLLTTVGTAAVRAPRQFTATRALSRTHQDILVFVKGSRKEAAQRLGDVELMAWDEEETA